MIDRLPPQSEDAERSVLGGILYDRDVMTEVGDVLEPADFYNHSNSLVYAAMVSLHEKRIPIDVVTVKDELARRGDLEQIGGTMFVSMLGGTPGSAAHAVSYAQIVKKKSALRGLIAASGKIADIAYEDPPSIEEALDRAEVAFRKAVTVIPETGRSPEPDDIIRRLETTKIEGIRTRLPTLQSLTRGMVKGNIWVIGGFTNVGKSFTTVNLVADIIRANGSAMIASTEMSQEQYMLRLLSLISGVPMHTLADGALTLEQNTKYERAKEIVRGSRLAIHDTLYTAARIRRKAKRIKELQGLDVVFVDFLQNLTETGDEYKDASAQSRQLQNMARELDVCVVVLSQLSNDQAKNMNESDFNFFSFKGAGTIAAAADLGVFLTRDKQNDPETMWWNIVKNRHSISNVRFPSHIDLATGRMVEVESDGVFNPNGGRGRREDA